MTSVTTYNITDKDLDSFIKKHSSERMLSWLCGNRISTNAVCEILKVSPKTLYNWIQAGQLMIINEGQKPHEFDLSEVIRLFLIRTRKLS